MDIRDAITSKCEMELTEPSEFALELIHEYSTQLSFPKITINIEHIKCVTSAIAIAVGNSELAQTWIEYHVALKDSISRIVTCGQLGGLNKKVYVFPFPDKNLFLFVQSCDFDDFFSCFLALDALFQNCALLSKSC